MCMNGDVHAELIRSSLDFYYHHQAEASFRNCESRFLIYTNLQHADKKINNVILYIGLTNGTSATTKDTCGLCKQTAVRPFKMVIEDLYLW
jgi:hypothetical protein